MKTLLYFSGIAFLFIIGVSCSNSDDDFLIPASTPSPTPVNTPLVNTPLVNTPLVNTPVINTLVVTTVDATFKADLKLMNGVTSTASGYATLQLDQTTKIIELHITFSGIEPYLASIHSASGVFVYNFTDSIYYENIFNSPLHFGMTLSDAEIKELMNNQFYLVLHTIAYPNGEISGTLIKNNDG